MSFSVPVLQIISVLFDSGGTKIDSSNLHASESSIKPLRKVDILGSLRTTNVSPSEIDSVLFFAENNSLPLKT